MIKAMHITIIDTIFVYEYIKFESSLVLDEDVETIFFFFFHKKEKGQEEKESTFLVTLFLCSFGGKKIGICRVSIFIFVERLIFFTRKIILLI